MTNPNTPDFNDRVIEAVEAAVGADCDCWCTVESERLVAAFSHALRGKHVPEPEAMAGGSWVSADDVQHHTLAIWRALHPNQVPPAAPLLIDVVCDVQRAAANGVADWNNRSTETHEGWVNELRTLADHRHHREGIPGFARSAMLVIARGLEDQHDRLRRFAEAIERNPDEHQELRELAREALK